MQRGDVVLLAFPFADGVGVKVRPALVVQSDRNNRRLTNTIPAMITTSTRAGREPTHVRTAPSSAAGKASGLLADSVVKCENLLTVEQRAVRRTIGHLPETAMRQVDRALRAALSVS